MCSFVPGKSLRLCRCYRKKRSESELSFWQHDFAANLVNYWPKSIYHRDIDYIKRNKWCINRATCAAKLEAFLLLHAADRFATSSSLNLHFKHTFFFLILFLKVRTKTAQLSLRVKPVENTVAFLGSILVTFSLESSNALMLQRRYLKFGRKALFALST